MDLTPENVNENNQSVIEKLMDTLSYFSDRIESFSYNESRQTIIRILQISTTNPNPASKRAAKKKDLTGVIKIIIGEAPHDSGEMQILSALVRLTLEGLYKDHYMIAGVCHLSRSNSRRSGNGYISDIDVCLSLDPFDSFPLHERALQLLKSQLKDLALSLGKDYPSL